MDLITHIPGVGPTALFNPGATTPAPYNVPHTGAVDGTGPGTATKNMAELYNRMLLWRRALIASSGLAFDPTNWVQEVAAIQALVSSSGLVASNVQTFVVTGTLPGTIFGGTAVINSASATTQTLPAANSVAAGRRIEFLNIGAGIGSVARVGADTLRVNSTTVTTLPLGNGDTLTLESDGVSSWYAVAGSARLKYAEAFKAGANYAKLPNGLIVQWGHNTTFNGGTITLPVAYTSGTSWTLGFAGWTLPVQPILTSKAAGSFVANGFGTTSGSTASSATDWIAVGT